MTATQIPADIDSDANIQADIDAMQAMADNPMLSDSDRLAWLRLVAATKAIVRGDMRMAATHLADSLLSNPDILDDIASR
jgi:hypothetical protein